MKELNWEIKRNFRVISKVKVYIWEQDNEQFVGVNLKDQTGTEHWSCHKDNFDEGNYLKLVGILRGLELGGFRTKEWRDELSNFRYNLHGTNIFLNGKPA